MDEDRPDPKDCSPFFTFLSEKNIMSNKVSDELDNLVLNPGKKMFKKTAALLNYKSKLNLDK